LKVFLAAVVSPPVCFDGDLLLRKCDVDLVSADGIVGLPAGDVVVAQQLDQQALGFRTRAVGCGLQ